MSPEPSWKCCGKCGKRFLSREEYQIHVFNEHLYPNSKSTKSSLTKNEIQKIGDWEKDLKKEESKKDTLEPIKLGPPIKEKEIEETDIENEDELKKEIEEFHSTIKAFLKKEDALKNLEDFEGEKKGKVKTKAKYIGVGIRDPLIWSKGRKHLSFNYNIHNPFNVTRQLCTTARWRKTLPREQFHNVRRVGSCSHGVSYYRLLVKWW
jgi:uncharacterized C2H2 Zn-finger protein